MSVTKATNPVVGVGAVVWKQDQFLLVKRAKPPRQGLWSLPGGAQELGETYRETALREVKEEAGIDIEIVGLVDVVDSIHPDGNGDYDHHYTIVDVAALWASGNLIAGDDASDARWFTLEDLDTLDLWDETVRVIRESRTLIDDHQS